VPTITGPASLCAGSGSSTYTTQAGFTNYVWTVSSGGTINSGQSTNTLIVTWNASGSQTVSVNYTNANGCSALTPTVYGVTVNPLPNPAGPVTGTPELCAGTSGVAYTVAPVPNASAYVWTLPMGATISSGNGSSSITVDFADDAASGSITVNGNNVCGNGNPSPLFDVTVNPIPPAPVITANGVVLSSNAPAGNQWYMDNSMIPGATGQSYTVTQNGTYWDVVTLNSCVSDTSNHIIYVLIGIGEKNQGGSLNVYPNPSSDGMFTLVFSTAAAQTFNLSVLNNLGLTIYTVNDIRVKGTMQKMLDLKSAPNGVYSIILQNNDTHVVKKIIINK
jgi:hypothetical protein